MSHLHLGILTFNNRVMLTDLLRDIEKQTLKPDKVFVVDNASTDGTEDFIKTTFPAVTYERLPENTGSGGGYHRLLEIASQESDFVWTLDDDVRIVPDTLENLVAGFKKLSRTVKLGAVRSTGDYHTLQEPTPLDIVPWRGTLFSATLIKEIGLPRREYFLYGDDIEYSLRMKKAGYTCFWIPASKCNEARKSNKTSLYLFGKTFAIYSEPYRHYYGFRNEINIMREYREIKRLLKTLLYAIKVTAVLLVAGKTDRHRMIDAVIRGVTHGFGNRLGRNDRFIP